jgi:hypothetical protein
MVIFHVRFFLEIVVVVDIELYIFEVFEFSASLTVFFLGVTENKFLICAKTMKRALKRK